MKLKQILFVAIIGCLALALYAFAGGRYSQMDAGQTVGYLTYTVSALDTTTAVDTCYSDTLDISDWEVDYFNISVLRTSIDTGLYDEADTVGDTTAIYLYTAMSSSRGAYRTAYLDTFMTNVRDSVMWRAIPRDSLYNNIWFEIVNTDSVEIGADSGDTEIHYFMIDVSGQ